MHGSQRNRGSGRRHAMWFVPPWCRFFSQPSTADHTVSNRSSTSRPHSSHVMWYGLLTGCLPLSVNVVLWHWTFVNVVHMLRQLQRGTEPQAALVTAHAVILRRRSL